ncbi:hypothetical protein CARUB_v10013784mg [Capsella rubella]|uniref:F-box domain-containing protein n=1 Tax=Capsella rubella TaxID=81985 RepID=R0G539_9BRAS|nr:putative F-box protein At3g52320 [Capsella rubella]EOA30647.1 hypothetical protein CARUB_v10013784mg [Capsella rubella]
MRLSFGLAAVKGLRKKKVAGGGRRKGRRRSIVKADARSAATFGETPEEVWMEILARLPVNSLLRFKCVSKLWSSLISSRYFTNFFFKLSSQTLERRVFMSVVDLQSYSDYMLFSASSPRNWDASVSFLQLNEDLTLPAMRGHFVNPLRGLMCFRLGREVRIYNLTTRQLLRLPIVESNMWEGDSLMWNYFGHDPVSDEYKVLSNVSSVSKGLRRVSSETQVLVLGAGASWRNTRSHTHPPHRPYSQGISINGVLYYGAWCLGKRCVLISFNLASEEFNLIELPVEAGVIWHPCRANLMNYRGKVAVFECSRLVTECMLQLWVVEDAGKSKWSHKVFVLPCHELRQSLDINELLIRSTSRSGEVRLSRRRFDRSKTSINVIYDLEKNRIAGGVVMEPLYPRFTCVGPLRAILWDDVESIMYLEG